MKVLVCGSRGWTEDAGWLIRRRLNELPRDAEMLVGDASGADRIAYLHWSLGLGRKTRCFFACWRTLGKKAGVLRNVEMLEQAPDLVIAFWDSTSPGTRHTIEEAKRRGIPVEVIEQ